MKIVDPSFEIITEANPLKRIEIAGRVCYKSEDRITEESAKPFVQGVIKRGHTSVLEHVRVFVPSHIYLELMDDFSRFDEEAKIPYGSSDRIDFTAFGSIINARDFIAFGGTVEDLESFQNATGYMTVRFICDRAIANELARHRTCSFSQESTRYVNYGNREIEFIRPLPFEWAEEDKGWNHKYSVWIHTMAQIEKMYQELIESGCSPQEARDVLPLSTKTELIMTATFNHWDEVFKLRLAKAAHPQMCYLMEKLFGEYVKINPNHNCLDF